MKTRLTKAVRLNQNHKDVDHKNQNNELKEAKMLDLAGGEVHSWVIIFSTSITMSDHVHITHCLLIVVNVKIWI